MATVADIGVPGQPATNLTAWQAAVRDAITGLPIVYTFTGSTDGGGALNVTWPAALKGLRPHVQATPVTANAPVAVQFTSLTTTGATLQVYRIQGTPAGYAAEVHITASVPR